MRNENNYPSLSDYETYEEYEEACESYDHAESNYEDYYVEKYYERLYN